MAEVTFDIATKVVPPGQKIWAIFPGTGRKFYGTFLKEQSIFLDTPVLNLTDPIFADDKLLRRHVAMSHAWSAYYYERQEARPSRIVTDYPVKKGASFNAAVANVRHVYRDMAVGDLVMVGAFSQYDPVLIGEITHPFNPEDFTHYETYPRERIPIRRVQWLRTDFERRGLSQALSKLLSNRRAVIQIQRSLYEEVYQIAYGDYVVGEHSRYIYEGKEYKNIGLAILPGINLISYCIAAFNACEEEELEKFSELSIDQAIANYFEQDILYSFEVDFRSPGEYVLHAKRAALPLLVAVLVSATSGTISLPEARGAEVKNSAAISEAAPGAGKPDACTLEIQEKYKAIMAAIGAERFKQLCSLNKDAQHGVGLKVNVKQKKKK